MKIFKIGKIKKLIVIPVIIMVILTAIVPTKVQATKSKEGALWNFGEAVIGSITSIIGVSTGLDGDMSWSWDNIPGNLLKELIYLIVRYRRYCYSFTTGCYDW